MRFLNKRTNETKTAYAVEIRGEKAYVRFSEQGKEYAYNKDNIEVLAEEDAEDAPPAPFTVYKLTKSCYKCGQDTTVYTYILYNDGTNQDVVFPWDKERLLKNQDIFAHLQDPSIEYYGLKVLGDDEQADRVLLDKFPNEIKVKYSKTQGRSYALNLCQHCGVTQGQFFIYHQINEMIQDMRQIEIFAEER